MGVHVISRVSKGLCLTHDVVWVLTLPCDVWTLSESGVSAHGLPQMQWPPWWLITGHICHGRETVKLDVGKKHAVEKDRELRCAAFVSWYGGEYRR